MAPMRCNEDDADVECEDDVCCDVSARIDTRQMPSESTMCDGD